MPVFERNYNSLPKNLSELVLLARQNGWEIDLYEWEPPSSSCHSLTMICFRGDLRLYCDYVRDPGTQRWKFRIASIGMKPHRTADEIWRKEHCTVSYRAVSLTRQGTLWCIQDPEAAQNEFEDELRPVGDELSDISLLSYALSALEWTAKAGRLPKAGAGDEDEAVLGSMTRAIRKRIAKNFGEAS